MTLDKPAELRLKIPRLPAAGEGLMLRVTLSPKAISNDNRVEVRLAGNDRLIASFVGFGPAPDNPVSYSISIPRELVDSYTALWVMFLLRHYGPDATGDTADIEKAQIDLVPTSH
jgi:hypothetical protein